MIEAKKFLRRSAGNDAAGFEKDDAGSEEQGFAQIVGDEDDGLAEATGKRAEFALKFGAGDGVERAEGLVHEKDRWIGGEGAGNADTLALASGELARSALGIFARIEADKLEHFFDAGVGARSIPFFKGGDEGDVFCHAEMGEKAGILDDITDPATEADGVPVYGGAILDKDLPF
jgi:hypothetical protein